VKPRVLFLGAGPLTPPAIRHARERGWEIITADYLPENPGHRSADRSHSISAADIPAVISLAENEHISAVIGFASEICALAAAAVADHLDLPGPGREAAESLSNKDQFRAWTTSSGLQPIRHSVFWANETETAARWADDLGHPVVVKPTDNSGSRGVTVDPGPNGFAAAFQHALACCRSRCVLIEQKLERAGPQICGDGFVEDGKLVFAGFGDNQAIAEDGAAAIFIETYPSSHPPEALAAVRDRLAALIAASGFRRGPINFDAIVLPNGEPHVFEIGIRSGGNLLPQAIGHHAGIDLIAAAVDCALDPGFRFPAARPAESGYLITYVVHSRQAGVLKEIRFSPEIAPFLVEWTPFRAPGDAVTAFRSASDTLGVALLTFPSREEMLAIAARLPDLCQVILS
jgi:biotin carboxylase